MTVHLTNPSRSAFVTTLFHESYCLNGGKCKCRRVVLRRPVPSGDGTFGVRLERRRVPQSLRLEPGEKRGGLPDAIMSVPGVKDALNAKPALLRAVLVPSIENPPAPKSASVAVAPMSSSLDDTTQDESTEPRSQEKTTRKRSSKSRS
jgi:hypothetical protein